jgi:hypothetical protein
MSKTDANLRQLLRSIGLLLILGAVLVTLLTAVPSWLPSRSWVTPKQAGSCCHWSRSRSPAFAFMPPRATRVPISTPISRSCSTSLPAY